MFKIKILTAVLLTSIAMSGVSYTVGYSKGVSSQKAAQEKARIVTQKELFDFGIVIAKQASELEEFKLERENRVLEIEKEAIVAPGSDNPGISATGGLYRLQLRWGSSG